MDANRRPRSRKSIAYLPSPDENSFRTGRPTENATIALNLDSHHRKSGQATKRTRSKSLGLEELEILRDDTGNRQKLPAAGVPKSILKPSIPLSPLRTIPARKIGQIVKQRGSPSRGSGKMTITPQRRETVDSATSNASASTGGPSPLKSSSVSPSKLERTALLGTEHHDEEELEAAQEEKKKTQEEVLKQRDLRRKSLANRRVSFAPEATLHTWDMIEEMQDATTSSASMNSTRRVSGMSGALVNLSPDNAASTALKSSVDDSPSTPRSGAGLTVPMSPATPLDLRREQQRGLPSGNPLPKDLGFEAVSPLNQVSSASVLRGSSISMRQEVLQTSQANETTRNPAQIFSNDPISDKENVCYSRITPGYDDVSLDDSGDVSMDLTDAGIPLGFQSWDQEPSSLRPENFNPFSPAFKNSVQQANHESLSLVQDSDDMSMDMSRAVGSIVVLHPSGVEGSRHGGLSPTQHHIIQPRRRSLAGNSIIGESTMDLTTAIGSIHQLGTNLTFDKQRGDDNEELSMELTSVFRNAKESIDIASETTSPTVAEKEAPNLSDQADPTQDDGEMDLTVPVGSILHRSLRDSLTEAEKEEDDDMDMTRAMGGILESIQPGRPVSSTIVSALSNRSEPQPSLSLPTTPRVLCKTFLNQAIDSQSHSKNPITRAFSVDQSLESSHNRAGLRSEKLDVITEPTILPWSSVSSGNHKTGLGPPVVAAMVDRRASIGDNHIAFAAHSTPPGQIRFEDPVKLSKQAIMEQEEEQPRESNQSMMEKEINSRDAPRDATTNLKEAIVSMTPRKRKLGGRKSLAMGSAKGLLGVRPAELDDFMDDAELRRRDSVSASPTKRMRLQKHQNATNETKCSDGPGVLHRQAEMQPNTPIKQILAKGQVGTTPKTQTRFGTAEAMSKIQGNPSPNFAPPIPHTEAMDGKEVITNRLHFSEFLELVNIRFIELDTTKRRHTVLPSATTPRSAGVMSIPENSASSEDCAVSSICTIPLLELYQHSCRELRKYISEGRNIIRKIEEETLDSNPPLFKEYLSASPVDRSVMDNQFRNMKAHARLASKGMWYEWRIKLLDGLKDALDANAHGLQSDLAVVTQQEQILMQLLPPIADQREILDRRCAQLQVAADEFANYRKEDVVIARETILRLDEQSSQAKKAAQGYEQRLRDMDIALENAQRQKTECMQSLREVEILKEKHRAWSVEEVSTIQTAIEKLEAKHGWVIARATTGSLTMIYRGQLQLFFNPASFEPAANSLPADQRKNTPISLSYIDNAGNDKAQPLTTEKRFFLQLMRAHLQCLSQHQTGIRDLLHLVGNGWNRALAVANEIKALDLKFSTSCRIFDDEHLVVRAVMLLPVLETKVHVTFSISAMGRGMEIEIGLKVSAEVVYGEKYKEDRMGEFLMSKLGRGFTGQSGEWVSAVHDLRKRLVAQGKKK